MSGTALYDSDGNFIGHSIEVQHHTTGTRAWCLEGMSEWCYPSSPCDSCQRARMGDPWEAIQRVRELCESAITDYHRQAATKNVVARAEMARRVLRALDGGAE